LPTPFRIIFNSSFFRQVILGKKGNAPESPAIIVKGLLKDFDNFFALGSLLLRPSKLFDKNFNSAIGILCLIKKLFLNKLAFTIFLV